MISQETIDRVFAAMDIVQVVEQFVPDMKKSGNSYRAKSPFAEEKSPSFFVVPSKQIFKDFSTGKGGNAISFVMEKERMSFPEAIEWLCSFYKIEVKRDTAEQSEQAKEFTQQASEVLAYAERKYSGMLKGSVAYTELMERGLSDDEVVEWGLGYAGNEWQTITKSITERGMLQVATDIGIVRKGKKHFDALRGRITIPIHDHNGVLRGFAGRICKAHQEEHAQSGKYVNPDESPYYNKSSLLYGMHKARKAIVESGKVYLLEGYMDVIAAHRMGMINSVGICGTALTDQQLHMVGRLMKKPHIVLAFDGDKGGIKATLRAVDMVVARGWKCEVMMINEGKDLDQFVKEQCLTPITEEAHV